jgi:hypothetical protein
MFLLCNQPSILINFAEHLPFFSISNFFCQTVDNATETVHWKSKFCMHHGWCLFYFNVIIYSLQCVTGGDLEKLVRETEGKITSNIEYCILLDGHDM